MDGSNVRGNRRIKRAVSSFGRALPWHGRGEEFDSPTVHNSIWAFIL